MTLIRPRRNRKSAAIRSLVEETKVGVNDLIAPLFVTEKDGQKEEILAMPGQFRFGPDLLLKEIKELFKLGIKGVVLFPVVSESKKDPSAKEALNPNSFYLTTIKKIKDQIPEMMVMTDIALDPYSSDGHDGLVDAKTGEILNDQTIEILVKMALLQAQSGADILGPSDMMDGRIKAIRSSLDEHNFKDVSIMSYTAKYASNFYGPFRDALNSAPKKGDKKSYQMNYANAKEALLEMELDTKEGADILMVKPALSYLDVIYRLKEKSLLPIAAYNVSGEYSLIKAASLQGWVNHDPLMIECLTSIKRAGADIILSYFAKEFALLKRDLE